MLRSEQWKRRLTEALIGVVGVGLIVGFGVCMILPIATPSPDKICAPGLWKLNSCVLVDAAASYAVCEGDFVGISSDRFGLIESVSAGDLLKIRNRDQVLHLRTVGSEHKDYLLAVNFGASMAVAHSKGGEFTPGGAQPRFQDLRVLSPEETWVPSSTPQLKEFSRWNVVSIRPSNDEGFICLIMKSLGTPSRIVRFTNNSGKLLPFQNAIDLSGDGARALLAERVGKITVFRVIELGSGLEIWRFVVDRFPNRLRLAFALDWSGARCFVFEPSAKRDPNAILVYHRDGISTAVAARAGPDSTSAWFGAWIASEQGGTISWRFIYTEHQQ